MKYLIKIEQPGKYGQEMIHGKTESFNGAAKLMELIIDSFPESTVSITVSNKNENEEG